MEKPLNSRKLGKRDISKKKFYSGYENDFDFKHFCTAMSNSWKKLSSFPECHSILSTMKMKMCQKLKIKNSHFSLIDLTLKRHSEKSFFSRNFLIVVNFYRSR